MLLALGAAATAGAQDLCRYVDPFIGTGDHGHTHPAAVVPHGMVQPGPDTRHHGWDACSGYHHDDRTVNGFSQTRLSGTGCGDMGDFLIMPLNQAPNLVHAGEKENKYRCPWASPFSHEREAAAPGYYSVWLDRYAANVEITATQRTAAYRVAFDADQIGEWGTGLLVDLDYNNQNQYVLQMDYETPDDHTLLAFRRTLGWAYNQPIYMALELSEPFDVECVRDTVRTADRVYPCCKLILRFRPKADGTAPAKVEAKLAISYVDYDGAVKNLAAEQPAWDFDGVRSRAHALWNKTLGKIRVNQLGNAAADSTLRIFYTGLYHAALAPTLFCDVDGRHLGMDINIHQGNVSDPMYTVFSLWDTHRALHPLVSLIAPEMNEAYIRSLITKGDEGGIVPKWELTGNYTACMIGYHFASLAADMMTKGFTNFDRRAALRHSIRSAVYDTAGITPRLPKWKMNDLMPIARYWNNRIGYVPFDKSSESVAKGLEYAYNDFCIAEMAKLLGDEATEKNYREKAKAYRNYFDASVGFMRGKDSRGNWRQDFDPTSSSHRMDDYTEGNAWQWTWFVPHDPQGLVSLFGGRKQFLAKLDSLFVAPSVLTGDNVSPDITGLIGQYAHGNEPSHATIYLYSYVGEGWKTQALADSIMRSLYFDGPRGLSGNEDCGQMSAWYVLNAIGFYQPCPGKPEYCIARPLFGEVALQMPGGTLTVRTLNNAPQNKYVQSVRLNGKKLKTLFFQHQDIRSGGLLEIEMGPKPKRK